MHRGQAYAKLRAALSGLHLGGEVEEAIFYTNGSMDPNPMLPLKEGAPRNTPGVQLSIAMPFKSSNPIRDRNDLSSIAKTRDMTV